MDDISNGGGWSHLCDVGQHLRKRQPDLAPGSYCYSKLMPLMRTTGLASSIPTAAQLAGAAVGAERAAMSAAYVGLDPESWTRAPVRSPWRSHWAGTASRTSPCCGVSRPYSARSPPTRPSPA
ncbi:OST-HTH/LOTUS domain-containing protein [Streptomyces hawaiiensis]|uniref:OST-HTH/LOTUS domain-containing protein n=1 Tax=Streptomyces hawaiiensis TaxID=67305 RepID=UPI00365C42F9